MQRSGLALTTGFVLLVLVSGLPGLLGSGCSTASEHSASRPFECTDGHRTDSAMPCCAVSSLAAAGDDCRCSLAYNSEVAVVAQDGRLGAALERSFRWPPPAEVRLALEELGVVFLKLGQVLALRRDLLPDAYVGELERLHDRLPAVGFAEVRATVERELGAPLAELFAAFDETPLAAATNAQVHPATLTGGRGVVVKVRRQGLEKTIAEDVAALSLLAAAAENLMPGLRGVDAVGLVRQLADSLRRETDSGSRHGRSSGSAPPSLPLPRSGSPTSSRSAAPLPCSPWNSLPAPEVPRGSGGPLRGSSESTPVP